MPGARCTRGLVCKVAKKCAHEHTGSAEAVRHSLRNGFTAYAVLSPATNSSCHRRCRLDGCIDPVGSNSPPRSLAPATGVGTTRFCRTQPAPFVLRAVTAHRSKIRPAITLRADAIASTASHPAFVTIAIRPSWGMGWRELVELICPTAKAIYFFARGLDDPNQFEMATKNRRLRNRSGAAIWLTSGSRRASRPFAHVAALV